MAVPKLSPPGAALVTSNGASARAAASVAPSPAELEQPWLTGQAPPSAPKSAPVG